jgi:hypothetical protein
MWLPQRTDASLLRNRTHSQDRQQHLHHPCAKDGAQQQTQVHADGGGKLQSTASSAEQGGITEGAGTSVCVLQ